MRFVGHPLPSIEDESSLFSVWTTGGFGVTASVERDIVLLRNCEKLPVPTHVFKHGVGIARLRLQPSVRWFSVGQLRFCLFLRDPHLI
jgi:hypothetical protein